MAQKPTPEFRAEAVRIELTNGLSRKQVAADLGIGFSTLSRWIQHGQPAIFTTTSSRCQTSPGRCCRRHRLWAIRSPDLAVQYRSG